MSIITVPFSWLLLHLYYLFNNYGVAMIMFAVVVKLVMLPFQMKSKRSMMRMSRFTPKMKELEKKYEGNKQKYQEELAKLYKEEGVNPMSGCLWSLIPFPIIIALYSVVRQPLTRTMALAAEEITKLTEKLTSMGLYTAPARTDAYVEINISQVIHNNWAAVTNALPELKDKLVDIDWSFLGLNLGNKPQWNFFMNVNWGDVSDWLPALGLFLIPFISAFMSWLSMKISNKTSVQQDEAQNSMKGMMMFMPLMSLYICFIMPGALGIYWIMNSVLAIIQEVILTKHYNRILDIEDADRLQREKEREEELAKKHAETERRRAAGETTRNPNTSKRKIQAGQKAKDDERIAAVKAVEKAERKAKLGIVDEPDPESQVGNRRYARGRAYVADRYSNPDAENEAKSDDAQTTEKAPDEEKPEITALPEAGTEPEIQDEPADDEADFDEPDDSAFDGEFDE